MRILSVLIAGWLALAGFCAPAFAQLAIDLVVEGTAEACTPEI